MTCKLHIPIYYNPLRDEWTCECGRVVETAKERALKVGPRR
jgi:hypothetical protein